MARDDSSSVVTSPQAPVSLASKRAAWLVCPAIGASVRGILIGVSPILNGAGKGTDWLLINLQIAGMRNVHYEMDMQKNQLRMADLVL